MLYNHKSVYVTETHEFIEPTSHHPRMELQSHEPENFFLFKEKYSIYKYKN